MMTTTTKTNDLHALADAIAKEEFLVETNDGTFGATECRRKRGCGDPAFGVYRIYETAGGERRIVGDPEDAPGYARNLNRDALAAAKTRLREVREEILRTR